jgi:hypothetical protein
MVLLELSYLRVVSFCGRLKMLIKMVKKILSGGEDGEVRLWDIGK